MKNKIKDIEKYLPKDWKEKCKELKALRTYPKIIEEVV